MHVGTTNTVKTSKRVGLVILILVPAAFVVDFAIKRSSRAANSSGLRQSLVALYRGDVGFWLMGGSVTTPVSDWSFTDADQTVLVETRTPYLVPHFVRTFIARSGAQLYLFSEYFAPTPGQTDLRDHFPEARFWNRMVVRDPRIRVKIGNKVFKMRAYPITDENAKQAARQAFFSKYPDLRKQEALPESQRPRLHFFRLTPGWDDQS
jgi:hypothetical protein